MYKEAVIMDVTMKKLVIVIVVTKIQRIQMCMMMMTMVLMIINVVVPLLASLTWCVDDAL